MKKIVKNIVIASAALLFGSIALADDYPNSTNVKTPVEQNVEGKILVQQFLWHKCIHCYKLDPLVDEWTKTKPSFIDFERIPVTWNDKSKEEAKFYNYAKTLNKIGKMDEAALNTLNYNLFKITFESEQDLTSKTVYPLFKDYGITSEEELDKAINSFASSAENSKGAKLTDAYGITGVPMFVINGKYIVGFQTLKDIPVNPENIFKTIETISTQELDKRAPVKTE